MRISPQQQRELHTALRRRFGAAARLWLFGERLDVVLYAPALDPQPRPIHQLALARGIELTPGPA